MSVKRTILHPRLRSGKLLLLHKMALLAVLGTLQACASSSSATMLPYGNEVYQPEQGSVQSGDLNHLSQGSLIW